MNSGRIAHQDMDSEGNVVMDNGVVLNAVIPYEYISNLHPTKAVEKADEVISEGWSKRGYEVLRLSRPIPWELNDQALRSWSFNIHSLDMIDALLAAYCQTSELVYLKPALRIGLDWVRKHPRSSDRASPMAWYDMAVGLRAYRLAYLYQAADKTGLLSDTDASIMWDSLESHRAELADDANIAFHNNHGYFQVAGQLAMGRRFAEISSPMAALHLQGTHRFERMLNQQFGTDGVHREHSPDYHRMVAETLLGLIRAGLVEKPELLARTSKIEEALAWFITPEGKIANFGDSDSRKIGLPADDAIRKWETPALRAVVSSGETGGEWPRGLRKFPETGYAIVRVPSPEHQDQLAQDTYLAQTAAFHSRTHKHCDDLSFIWHERGQPLLVDAGRYGYIGKTEVNSDLFNEGFWYSDPMRMFIESSRAHNTLEFDDKNVLRKDVKPYGSAFIQACEHDGIFCIETRCKQNHSIWHDRLLLLKPGQWLVIFDVYKDLRRKPHNVRQWFHLAPGHKATPAKEGYDIALRDGGDMVIRSLMPLSTVGEVVSGRREAPIQGWWSGTERQIEPAEALSFCQIGKKTGVFATVISLSSQIESITEHGRSDTHGHKARFSWVDDYGQHQIDINRRNGFSLKYNQKIEPGMDGSFHNRLKNLPIALWRKLRDGF